MTYSRSAVIIIAEIHVVCDRDDAVPGDIDYSVASAPDMHVLRGRNLSAPGNIKFAISRRVVIADIYGLSSVLRPQDAADDANRAGASSRIAYDEVCACGQFDRAVLYHHFRNGIANMTDMPVSRRRV